MGFGLTFEQIPKIALTLVVVAIVVFFTYDKLPEPMQDILSVLGMNKKDSKIQDSENDITIILTKPPELHEGSPYYAQATEDWIGLDKPKIDVSTITLVFDKRVDETSKDCIEVWESKQWSIPDEKDEWDSATSNINIDKKDITISGFKEGGWLPLPYNYYYMIKFTGCFKSTTGKSINNKQAIIKFVRK